MLSNRAEPRSIATQLVLLFTICATLLLSCSLGVLYWIVLQHASEEDTAVLNDKVLAVQDTLKQPDGINTINTINRELKNLAPGEPTVFWIRIIDSNQTVVAETPAMEKLLPATAFPRAKQFNAPVVNLRVGNSLFSLTSSLSLANDQVYTVQIAQDRSADRRFRKQFGALLALVLGLGTIASALVAVIVTRRGLRPLSQMRRALERVRPAHLNERIDPERWPAELRPLAASFDDMLGRLEDSFTRLSQFSADLAHELRTPIGNMLGEAQVALTRDRRPEEYRRVIESAAAECERLSGIIDNLLFVARAESAEQQVNRSVFDGGYALEKIVSFYQISAEDAKIRISCDGKADVFADPLLFNRAVGNLVENALHFTPQGREIRISLRRVDKATEVSVRDSGSGIAPEHLPRVFDRFYRGDPSRSSAGTGLGLALVKSIVDLHHGSVAIDSTVGRGTEVKLTFPDNA